MALPSPSEFQPYRKVQGDAEKELARILELAAKAIRKRVAALPVGVGGEVRAAQLRMTLVAINKIQRSMWLTAVSGVVDRRSRDAQKAGEDAVETLTRVAYAALPERAAEALVESLRLTAESGIKSDAARRKRELSAKVYKNLSLATGKVEDIIRTGLISGLSARELSGEVYDHVSPTAKGGASYSAMRLARTEINNAFHERQVAGATRPGVIAVEWNLSGSHRVPDECNVLAAKREFPPDAVPDKPHPQCFCYLTYKTMPKEEFKDALAAGKFDDELERRTRENMARLGQRVGDTPPNPEPGAAQRVVPKNSNIKRSVLSGEKSSEKLTGGVSAQTSKVKYNDGSTGVKKYVDAPSAKREQDAEEMVPMLARMMGIKAPEVMRVDEKTTVQQFLSGSPAMDAVPWVTNAGTKDAKILNSATRAKPYVDSDTGWLMAVLDQITGNQDRHDGNWLVDQDGNISGVIDHGLAYTLRDWRTKRHDLKDLSEPYIFRTKSEFTKKFAKTNGDQTNIDFHPEDLDAIEEMMVALKDEYRKRDRLDWWQFSMGQIGALRPFARGKKRRIQ